MTLESILESKRAEVARARRLRPVSSLLDGLSTSGRDFEAALRRPRTGFVLECKRRSPSAGAIRDDADPVAVARAYAPYADAISVLTDGPYFGGSLDDLKAVRAAVDVPVLRKDFMLEPYQVVEARAAGADAVLLMLSVLSDALWRACSAAASECGMCVLTEVHDETELERALALGARVVGINNRDLRTLRVDLAVFDRLAPRVPADRLVVCESGLRAHTDVVLRRDRADAFLVGTALMREPDLDRAVRRLIFGEVKICGLTRVEDARDAWRAGATWGGLVLAPGSPRHVEVSAAREIRAGAPLRWAGVFVDEMPRRVAEIARRLDLDAVQLHGEETIDEVRAVRAALPARCEVWKAVRIGPADRVPRLADTGADRLLMDAHDPSARGGTGRRFDWALAASHPDRDRVVLAGGITPDHAALAESVGAGMLDVSSGVEEAPGIKSRAKLEALFSALRGPGRERR